MFDSDWIIVKIISKTDLKLSQKLASPLLRIPLWKEEIVMKLIVLVALLLTGVVHAKITPTLSMSISAAKAAAPGFVDDISKTLNAVQKACDEASRLDFTQSEVEQKRELRMQQELLTAIDHEISRIDKAVKPESSCGGLPMPLNLPAHGKKEGIAYLHSVKSDIARKDYAACSDKLLALAGEVSDEN